MQVGDLYNPHRIFTGVFIPDSMVCSVLVSSGAKLAFGRLCWYAGKDGQCFPTLKTLGSDIGVSERSAQEYILELESIGFIRRSRRGPGSNDYKFVWHQELEDSLKQKDPQDSAYQEKDPQDSAVKQISVKRSAESRKKEPCINKVLREDLREVDSEPESSVSQNSSEQQKPCESQMARRMWERIGKTSLKSSERSKFLEVFPACGMSEDEVEVSIQNFWEWAALPKDKPIKSHVGLYLAERSGGPRKWITVNENKRAYAAPASSEVPNYHSAPQDAPQAVPQPVIGISARLADLYFQLGEENSATFKKAFDKIRNRHPNKRNLDEAEILALEQFIAGEFELRWISLVHHASMSLNDWWWEGGIKAPTLYSWIAAKGWKSLPPNCNYPGHLWVEYGY